jgi:hypothetical protein
MPPTSGANKNLQSGKDGEPFSLLAKEFIQKNLEQLSKQHKGITKGDRLKSLIERFNANLDKLGGISVDGVTLSQGELEQIKVNMPHCMKATQLTSIASTKNPKNRGCDKLVFEIRY